jgi:hypothetical protein
VPGTGAMGYRADRIRRDASPVGRRYRPLKGHRPAHATGGPGPAHKLRGPSGRVFPSRLDGPLGMRCGEPAAVLDQSPNTRSSDANRRTDDRADGDFAARDQRFPTIPADLLAVPASVARGRGDDGCATDGHDRHHDRQRRAAHDPARPRRQRHPARVGGAASAGTGSLGPVQHRPADRWRDRGGRVGTIFFSSAETHPFIDAFTHTVPFAAVAFLIAGALSLVLPRTAVAEEYAADRCARHLCPPHAHELATVEPMLLDCLRGGVAGAGLQGP